MKFSKIACVFTLGLVAFALGGCARQPTIVEIEPSKTAFLVPMDGKTSKQEKFESEDFLKNKQVGTKRVVIPWKTERWGTGPSQYNWVPESRLIVVDRLAVSRAWTQTPGTDENKTDDAFKAESKDSIGFTARFNIVVEIRESDAAAYLYNYGATKPENADYYVARPLETVLDKELRNRISGKFSEQASTYTYSDLVQKKAVIMKEVRIALYDYFKKRGITITSLDIEGEFTPTNPKTQEILDKKFEATQANLAQASINSRIKSEAQANAEAASYAAKYQDVALKLERLKIEQFKAETERIKWARWSGYLPVVSGGAGSFGSLPPQMFQYTPPTTFTVPLPAPVATSTPKPEEAPVEE